MARIVFDLLVEPADDLYYGLLDFALTECTVAVLVQERPELGEAGHEVMRQLAGFLRGATESDEWPGTKTSGWTATVLHYDYVPACAEILKRATNQLYGWQQGVLPEDLSLLRRDGDPWLVTISHEMDGYLRLSREEKARLVEALPGIGPVLCDERCQEERHGAWVELQRMLDAWDEEGWAHFTYPPGEWWGPEAQAIHYALASGEARTVEGLTQFVSATLHRSLRRSWGEDASIPPDACADLARAIWAWWQAKQAA